MTEQEAVDHVKIFAQTADFPALEDQIVEGIVRRHVRAAVWSASTAYKIGARVQPTDPNGHFYQCVVAGTSDEVEPEWTLTIGGKVSEFGSDLTWEECETDYAPDNLYNLRNAVHEAWILKAGRAASLFDVSIEGNKWTRSQIHQFCLEMAQRFAPID